MRTPTDLHYLATLTTIFVVVFGAMMTPVVLALTRPIHPAVERLARRAAWNTCKAALARALRWAIAVATATVALSIVVTVFATPANAQTREAAQQATIKAIERMIGVMDKVAKNPIVQAAKIIARGYTAVKVYRLSREVKGLNTDVAALRASVHAILAEVTGVIARTEAGEALTADELEAVNARIDVHAVRIAAAEAEIEVLKFRMDEADRKLRKTAASVAAHKQRIERSAKGEFGYCDPKCRCRRDIRFRDLPEGARVARGHDR